jgi:hypothetical protein
MQTNFERHGNDMFYGALHDQSKHVDRYSRNGCNK